MPVATANVFNKWTFSWIQPLMIVGSKRTLVDRDLWALPDNMRAEHLSDTLMANFDRRRAAVEKWNKELEDGTYKPSAVRKLWWKVEKRVLGFGDGTGKRKVGIAMALSDTFFYTFWSGGVIKVIGDTSQVTSPLVLKALINFATDSYLARRGVEGYVAPPVHKGVGLAIGLFLMQVLYSLSVHQFFVRSAGTGVLTRAALIASIYRRSMRLSGRARTVITNGRLVNHISTDVSRIDFCAGFFHVRNSVTCCSRADAFPADVVDRSDPVHHHFGHSARQLGPVLPGGCRLPLHHDVRHPRFSSDEPR